jgi:Domain of unknown function (DUF4349)
MKRVMLVLPLVALVSGCGQKPNTEDRSESRPFDVQESKTQNIAPAAADAAAESAGGPNIGVSSAPGVAFNYHYAFRLPNAKIAAVQEEHAQVCEKLGINRCRITGMRYRLVDEDEVSAMLAFKLDPALARQFGKDGIAGVVKAEGMLVDSEISGIDVGGAIKAADKSIAQYQDDLNRIQAQLAQKINNEERARLNEEAEEVRGQMRATKDDRAASKESLATTPMEFTYGSGSVIPGFDGASPITDAFKTAVASFMTMLGVILIAVGVLLPWLAFVGALWWVWQRFGKGRWFAKPIQEVIEIS